MKLRANTAKSREVKWP